MAAVNLQPIVDAVTRLDDLDDSIVEAIRLLNERIQNAGTLEEAKAIAAKANEIADKLATAITTVPPATPTP